MSRNPPQLVADSAATWRGCIVPGAMASASKSLENPFKTLMVFKLKVNGDELDVYHLISTQAFCIRFVGRRMVHLNVIRCARFHNASALTRTEPNHEQ